MAQLDEIMQKALAKVPDDLRRPVANFFDDMKAKLDKIRDNGVPQDGNGPTTVDEGLLDDIKTDVQSRPAVGPDDATPVSPKPLDDELATDVASRPGSTGDSLEASSYGNGPGTVNSGSKQVKLTTSDETSWLGEYYDELVVNNRPSGQTMSVGADQYALGTMLGDGESTLTKVYMSVDSKNIIKQYTPQYRHAYEREKLMTKFYAEHGFPIAEIMQFDDAALTIVKKYLPGNAPKPSGFSFDSVPASLQKKITEQMEQLRAAATALVEDGTWKDYLVKHGYGGDDIIPGNGGLNFSDMKPDNMRFVPDQSTGTVDLYIIDP